MRINHRAIDWLIDVGILVSSRVEYVTLERDSDQEEAMTSNLSVRSRCTKVHKMQSKVGRLLHAYYLSLLEQPVPGEFRSLLLQLSAIEAGNHPSTERAIDELQLPAAPIGRN